MIFYWEKCYFRAEPSIGHATISILKNVRTKEMEHVLVQLDFTESFDPVDHDEMLFKKEKYGIRGIPAKIGPLPNSITDNSVLIWV